LPGAENAGKPGYYTIRQGDTLTRIGLDHGQAWRDLAKWNNLDNPHVIETGQVIRVVPPNATVDATGVVVRPISALNRPNRVPPAPFLMRTTKHLRPLPKKALVSSGPPTAPCLAALTMPKTKAWTLAAKPAMR